ncbi:hypothetical protein Tco_1570118 [Tanacetum coccineum]
MGDQNQPITLGDYSQPIYEVYRKTIELPEGANVASLRSDTIRLVQKLEKDALRAQTPFYLESDFINANALGEWEIAMDVELNPFKYVLVFMKMVKFLGAIPINLKGNMWESEDMFNEKLDWNKSPKEVDDVWHIKIELIDPDGEMFDRNLPVTPTGAEGSVALGLGSTARIGECSRKRGPGKSGGVCVVGSGQLGDVSEW